MSTAADSLYLRRRLTNGFAVLLACTTALFGLFFLGWILWTLLSKGLPGINLDLFTKMTPPPMQEGGLLNAFDAMEALKLGQIGSLGLDVYENEKELFFEDKSNQIIQDDVFRRLSACHNVIFTGHQAFLTEEALGAIANTTLSNVKAVLAGGRCGNELF